MPQSLACLLLHLVFSTKHRQPTLTTEVRPDLHAYPARVARDTSCECLRVGGVEDHVQLALRLARTVTVAEVVRTVKVTSSAWMKTLVPGFAWQNGYGVFSVSRSDLPALLRYIDRQEIHHQQQSFMDEYRRLL